MNRFIAALVLTASVLAAGAASAAPTYGNATRDLARQTGQITPHGVFDAQ